MRYVPVGVKVCGVGQVFDVVVVVVFLISLVCLFLTFESSGERLNTNTRNLQSGLWHRGTVKRNLAKLCNLYNLTDHDTRQD